MFNYRDTCYCRSMLETRDPRLNDAALFALDWGTTSCRFWALDGEGKILTEAAADLGIMQARHLDPEPHQAFGHALRKISGGLVDTYPEVPVLCSGMVGSTGGWQEASYLPVPSDLSIERAALTDVPFGSRCVHIVPGLRVAQHASRPFSDVMRGEETQLIGAMGGLASATVVMPGTHTKWVQVTAATVESFTTAMTGDVYSALLKDTILSLTAQPADRINVEAFHRGMATEAQTRSLGLLGQLFSARTLGLDGVFDQTEMGDYLSGLLISHEVSHLAPAKGPIILCGPRSLCQRYALALEKRELTASTADVTTVTCDGLWRIANSTGLVTPK
jgi:2-dehydro-3-deoxygalactonokinase